MVATQASKKNDVDDPTMASATASALYHTGRHHIDALAPCPGAELTALATSALTGDVWDGRLVVLSGVTGEQATVAMVEETSAGVADVAWLSVDTLATGDDAGDVTVWQLSSGGLSQLFTLREHTQPVTAVAASAVDRTRLASTSLDGTAKVWAAVVGADTARTLEHLPVHAWCDVHVHSAAWFGGGAAEALATGASDGVLRLWDVRSAQPAAVRFAAHSAPLLCVADAAAASGSQLLATSECGSLLLYDTRKLEAPVVQAMPLHSVAAAAGGIFGAAAAVGREDAAAEAAPLTALAPRAAAGEGGSGGGAPPLVAVGAEDGSIAVVDPRDLHAVRLLRRAHAANAAALGWAANGRDLLSGGWDHRLLRHEIVT